MAKSEGGPGEAGARLSLRRAAPLIVLLCGAALGAWLLGDHISFEALERNREALLDWRDRNYSLTATLFIFGYVALVAFSIPGATWATIAGGFLFGTALGASYVVLAATVGATIIFTAAKTGLGDALRARASGWLKRFEQGFRENEVSYMLALRLAPVAPFFVLNIAPAFLGVRTRTFVWTTALGIIPGTTVYASIGAGLGELMARGEQPDLGVIFDWPVLGPLLGLAALALIPAIVKAVRGTPKRKEI